MRVYLSGLENKEIQDIYYHMKDRNGFFSHYYMRKSIEESVRVFKKAKESGMSVIVDSGAHSFFSEVGTDSASVQKKFSVTKESYTEYIDNYYKWLHSCIDYIDYFVELDIGEITGQELVDKWYQELLDNGLAHKCIRVFHPATCSDEWWEHQVNTNPSKYVGIEGKRTNKPLINYNKYIKIAYDKGVKVHGFAMTGKKDVMKYAFSSVDSTSWSAGLRFGTVPIWNDKKKCVQMRSIRDKNLWDKQMNTKEYHDKDKKNGRKNLSLTGMNAYFELEDYVTEVWNKRGIKWE